MERGQLVWVLFGTGLMALSIGTGRAEDEQQAMSSAPDHTFARAGNSNRVSCLAKPSVTPDSIVYQVGGGAPARLGSRNSTLAGPLQGTYGLDYSGRWFPRGVALRYFVDPKPQGGIGSYDAIEKRKVPNIFGIFNVQPEKEEEH